MEPGMPELYYEKHMTSIIAIIKWKLPKKVYVKPAVRAVIRKVDYEVMIILQP